MSALAGPLVAAGLLLAAAGVPKLRRPEPTRAALYAVGAAVPTVAVRGLGTAEVAVGLAAAVTGSRPAAALVCLCYLGFSAFLVAALARPGRVGSCGCTGRDDVPPTRAHLALTGAFAVLAGLAAGWPPGPLREPLAVAFGALSAWLGWLVVAELPRLSRRPT